MTKQSSATSCRQLPISNKMCLIRFIAVTVALILTGFHQTESHRIEFQALDAAEQLIRFQKPYDLSTQNSDSENWKGQRTDESVVTLADILLSLGDVPLDNVTEPCHSIMDHMAQQGGDFTHCLLQHSRPFRMCEKCAQEYTRYTHLYEDLLEDKICAPALLLADRMQVLTTIYTTFTDTWANAYCPLCYESIELNTTTGEVNVTFATDTLLFKDMHANVSQCFNDTSSANKSAVCVQCKDVYRQMNDKFSSLQSNSQGHICMDLVDMMNYTRLMWSSKFNCTRPRPNASIVIAISSMVVITTTLLYFTSKFIAKIRMPQIFKAKRMVTGSRRYGAILHDEVETSLPRFAATSPTTPPTPTNSRRGDSFRDVDGNGMPSRRAVRS